MNKSSQFPEFTESNINNVLGIFNDRTMIDYCRTPLHIDYKPMKNNVEPDRKIPARSDPKLFNAIGSLFLSHNYKLDGFPEEDKKHMPVLDVDLPIRMETEYGIDKVILDVFLSRQKEYKQYRPSNWLKPLLSKMGIDLEVFSEQKLTGGIYGTSLTPPLVKTVTLSAREADQRLVVFPSSNENHGHLYINYPTGINWMIYKELLTGFKDIGVIEADWYNQSIKQGMTIVRTPWHKAEPIRRRS